MAPVKTPSTAILLVGHRPPSTRAEPLFGAAPPFTRFGTQCRGNEDPRYAADAVAMTGLSQISSSAVG